MLCIAVMNVVIILTYDRLSLSNSLNNAFKQKYEELERQTIQIQQELENGQGDLETKLQEIELSEDEKIMVTDQNNNIVYEKKEESKEDNQYIANSECIVKDKENLYILKVFKQIDIDKIQRTEIVLNLVRVEIILILVSLIIISIFTNIEYLNPIVSIQESMKNYKKGIKPQRSIRKDEFGYLQNTFVDITQSLEKEKQKQNTMIASISHDVKTPLTSVMGYSEKLKKGVTNEEKFKKYINVIYDKSNAIKEIIDDFDEYLNYNLKSNLKKKRITTQELVNIVKADYKDEFENHQVDLKIQNKVPKENLEIDIEKFRRVFANLIGNSLKHLEKEEKIISIEIEKENENIKIIVADNGTGVKQEELSKIFDVLYTEDPSRKVSGFGLSICKEIVEAHEGKIWAETNEYGGLSIIILIQKNLKTLEIITKT